MQVAIVWGSDHEQQAGGLPVQGAAVDAVWDGDGGKPCLFDGVALGVGHGHAHADGSDALPFPFPDIPLVCLLVRQVPHLIVQLCQQVDGRLLGLHIRSDDDGLRRKKRSDFHVCYPFPSFAACRKSVGGVSFTSTIIA